MERVRAIGAWLHVVLAAAVAVGVFVQVYLIASYFFGAGEDALDAHKGAGFAVHGFEVLVLVAALIAWLPRTDLLLSLALALIGTAQIAFAESTEWTGGLHGLTALIVLLLAGSLLTRARARRVAQPA
jgi:hypothetical protein